MNTNIETQMLFPYKPEEFWQQMQQLIRQEVATLMKKQEEQPVNFETPGMTYKPLYKISEVCKMFQVTRPTIYDWIKHGKLNPHKIRSRVYFLWNDIQGLLNR